MPIKPPNLDDRRYADLVREARALIPQYTPEWTNLGDADPGMTLVQLFAWMTEMTIFRLNRVPDKTYVHFLNFIGEERREAQPALAPLTFTLRTESRQSAELPALTRASTRQQNGKDAIHFLTTQPITVHACKVERLVAVKAGARIMVREIPYAVDPELPSVLLFGQGNGSMLFKMDPVEHGPNAWTPDQYLYIAHDDFRMMDVDPKVAEKMHAGMGRMRLRTATDENLPVVNVFRWERYTQTGEWVPLDVEDEPDDVLGLPETSIRALIPKQAPVNHFGHEDDPFQLPAGAVDANQTWIRGVVDYERWLAARMQDDLEVTWRDDRGGEERLISNWDVRATGRALEFFVQDMPPIRAGWTVRMTLVDRSLPAGRNAYFPRYRFSYRRGETWEYIETDRVRYQGTSILIAGPFIEMATDGYNLRAERIETINLRALVPELELEATWVRPVLTHLAAGPETNAAGYMEMHQLPQLPFQVAPTLPPLLGMKFFLGSDVFENRAERPVLVEIEIGFDFDGHLIEEPKDSYHLQLTYRAADTWRVVHSEDDRYSQFTFADLDAEGALVAGKRKIRILLDPATQLKGLYRSVIAGRETCWLRIEMTRSALTRQPDKKEPPKPISLRVYNVKLGVDGIIGKTVYEQPMPGLKVATVEYRASNRRLTRAIVRSMGRLSEHYPFDRFIDLEEDQEEPSGHTAMYMKLDRPLPPGERHAFLFKTRGETYLPEGTEVFWEHMEQDRHGRVRWRRIGASEETGSATYRLNRPGVLEFRHEEVINAGEDGTWLRALFRTPNPDEIPVLPPVSHLMLNSVDAVNLHEFRMEKFSGEGIPNQVVHIRRSPVYLHPEEGGNGFGPDRFPDVRVFVTEEDGERREWRRAPGNTLLTASKDDRVFLVDPIEGTLTFGNGIRGKIVPVGSYNISVDVYHVVPGDAGNLPPGRITVCESFNDLVQVTNKLPAVGGRNPETVEEIIRRAPSVLTSRDRAVTRHDFEVIAREASPEVSRAACDGRMAHDGEVEVVILPQRREGEGIPDPFLSAGLKDHVQRYLSKRCLVNVRPTVRLAHFQEVDVSLVLRLRPNANFMMVRELARTWVRKFLDPYAGGLDGNGWPFGGTLYAQDFSRMVNDLQEVRHVVEVQVFEVSKESTGSPGWERGQGVQTLVLDRSDLFVVRHVRVVSEEGEA